MALNIVIHVEPSLVAEHGEKFSYAGVIPGNLIVKVRKHLDELMILLHSAHMPETKTTRLHVVEDKTDGVS